MRIICMRKGERDDEPGVCSYELVSFFHHVRAASPALTCRLGNGDYLLITKPGEDAAGTLKGIVDDLLSPAGVADCRGMTDVQFKAVTQEELARSGQAEEKKPAQAGLMQIIYEKNSGVSWEEQCYHRFCSSFVLSRFRHYEDPRRRESFLVCELLDGSMMILKEQGVEKEEKNQHGTKFTVYEFSALKKVVEALLGPDHLADCRGMEGITVEWMDHVPTVEVENLPLTAEGDAVCVGGSVRVDNL